MCAALILKHQVCVIDTHIRVKIIIILACFLGGYTATGFIVDASRGIILTNRHVVSPAPIVAQAVLTNYEEVDLKPVYRDPVHDFGFMQVWESYIENKKKHLIRDS